MSLVEALALWVSSIRQPVTRLGAVVTFDQSPGDRLNGSARLLVARDGREGELILWESGEAEFALVQADGSVVEEHFDQLDSLGMGVLLARILEVCE